MLTEPHPTALAVFAWAFAIPSAALPAPSIATLPDRSHVAAADRASRACPAAAVLAPHAGEPQLRFVRFYRAENGMTQVWAFLAVPPAEASPDPGYAVSVRVRDSTDRTVYAESWPGTPGVGSARARPLEMLHFLAAPGAYRLEVDVVDGDSSRRRHGVFAIRAYADDPGASDLLLAPRIRLDPSLDGPIGPGEFRHGRSVVTPAAVPCLPPTRARVFYLLEVYLEGMLAQAGTMEASVLDSVGRPLARTPPVAITVGTGGAVLRGQVPVAGLAPGAYALRVRAKVGTRTLERAAPFLVDSMRPGTPQPEVVLRRLRY